MEPKRTKKTPKPGENKPANINLLREMINVSNNSRLTMDAAKMLTNSLDEKELKELMEWLRHANRQISNKLAAGRRF
jgi:hypothetical protein